MSGKFLSSAQNYNKSVSNNYLNSRYAPMGNETVGEPFPAYKEYAARFTDNRPSGLAESTLKKQFNLPTNTNFFRTSLTQDAVNLGNTGNEKWVADTQTLENVGWDVACNSTTECSAWPGTTCNLNYENWADAHGNQSGGYCSKTFYPELVQDGKPVGPNGGGTYERKNATQGGIGKSCQSDSDCGGGYSCNNEYDVKGSNRQQTGYCAKTYDCGDGGVRFLGTPWNSGIPKPPANDQNMDGRGYPSKDVCSQFATPQQDCIRANNGRYYAVYPGYCPVEPTLRESQKPYGNVRTTGPQAFANGIVIPSYATNKSSSIGSKTQAFTTWNNPSSIQDGSTEAMNYSMMTNPIPKNLY